MTDAEEENVTADDRDWLASASRNIGGTSRRSRSGPTWRQGH
jgi:hypothetical protein